MMFYAIKTGYSFFFSRTNVLFVSLDVMTMTNSCWLHDFFYVSNLMLVTCIHVYILTNITSLFPFDPCDVEANCVSSLFCRMNGHKKHWQDIAQLLVMYHYIRVPTTVPFTARPNSCRATVGHSPMVFIPRGRLAKLDFEQYQQGLTLVIPSGKLT